MFRVPREDKLKLELKEKIQNTFFNSVLETVNCCSCDIGMM